ncbi:MAG: LOG family protein [Oceanococcaceae bacterium]
MTKAYRDPIFLNSPEARPLRILAEYLEPRRRLDALGVRNAIAFWGSARIRPGDTHVAGGQDYYAQAFALARRLVEWTQEQHDDAERYYILTGAGPGIMEAAHAGAASIDARFNLGLNISLPFEQSANPYIPADHLFEFHYFFTRKFWFTELARALVVFPGGFGTMDELFEVLTLMQTGKQPRRPVVLFGTPFWEEVFDVQALSRQGLISPEDLELLISADDVESAFVQLTGALEKAPQPGASESPARR